jgi:transglycosylase-like protein with SLT domain
MRVIPLLSLCAFVFCGSLCSAEIQIRIDEHGNKVFFNSPETKQTQIVTAGQPIGAAKKQEFAPIVQAACDRYNVDPDLVNAVIQVESAYNKRAVSHAGAIGLMQLMPATASRFGVKKITDPEENVHGGVQYLKFLLDLFNNDLKLAVAAYNAGEGAVKKYQGVPKYTETQNYVKRVLAIYGKDNLPGETAQVVYQFKDASGRIHFTTERPKSGDFLAINLSAAAR